MLTKPSYATEFATVEKVIEFAAPWKGANEYIRIEALKEESGEYTTHVYIKQQFELTDVKTIENSQPIQDKGDHYLWVSFPDAPYAHGNTADEALNFQMSLLQDRFKA